MDKTLTLRVTRAPDDKARIVATLEDRELFVDVCDLYSDQDRERVADAIHHACPAVAIADIRKKLLFMDRDKLPIGQESDQETTNWDDPVDVERPQVAPLMGADCEPLRDAAYVLGWLRDRGLPDVTRRDIGQHGRSRFDKDPDRFNRCLMLLIDRGWLRGIGSGEKRPGRPSVSFEVNPKALGKASVAPKAFNEESIPTAVNGRIRGVI